MERTVRRVASAVAFTVAVLIPVLYLFFGYQSQRAIVTTETEINGRLVSQLINANPDLWYFETQRLEALLAEDTRSIGRSPPQCSSAQIMRCT